MTKCIYLQIEHIIHTSKVVPILNSREMYIGESHHDYAIINAIL